MPDNVVLLWNTAALEAIAATRTAPTVAARALAILHTAIYDAWAAYDATAVGTRLGDVFRRPPDERTPANRVVAISFAAHAALIDLFPTQDTPLDALLAELVPAAEPVPGRTWPRTRVECPPPRPTPVEIGLLAARAVLDYRHGDGSNQLGDLHPGAYSDWTGYVPVNDPDHIRDPNRWQPLRVPDGHGGFVVQVYIGPHWGLVQPFSLPQGALLRPDGPRTLPYDADEYRAQSVQILEYSAGLTDRHKVIAEYWADNPGTATPPGHWSLFAQFVSRRDRHDLDDDVRLFFALGNALMDAGIVCWDAKRAFDSERPITSIHFLFRGQLVLAWRGPGLGTGLIDGADWQPYQPATVVTPPFAEYFSGHSTFSAAAAEILKRFTGSDAFGASFTAPAGSSIIEPGITPHEPVTLFWPTFSDAADQAGLSRRYGGIHFAEADIAGRVLGRIVADKVWRRVLTFTGQVLPRRRERGHRDAGPVAPV